MSGLALAEPPAAPPVSKFAPAQDLENQMSAYRKRLEEGTENENEYKDSQGAVTKQANTVILIALALGLHDEENQYKAAAPALIKAAQELSAAREYPAAKAGVEALKKAAESKEGPTTELKWTKMASLPELMKQVPTVNTRLKRNTRTEAAFKKQKKANGGDSAVLAVIAQGSLADTAEAKGDAAKVKQWYELCAKMRDQAAQVNAAVHKGQFGAAEKSMSALNKTCDECHEIFHPAAIGKAGE
jgi:hypothetical protein